MFSESHIEWFPLVNLDHFSKLANFVLKKKLEMLPNQLTGLRPNMETNDSSKVRISLRHQLTFLSILLEGANI